MKKKNSTARTIVDKRIVTSISCNFDSTYLSVSCLPRKGDSIALSINEINSQKPMRIIEENLEKGKAVLKARFLPNNNSLIYFLASKEYYEVKLYEYDSSEKKTIFTGDKSSLKSRYDIIDDKTLVILDKTELKIFNLDNLKVVKQIELKNYLNVENIDFTESCCAANNNKDIVAIGGLEKNSILLYDIRNNKELSKIKIDFEMVSKIFLDKNPDFLIGIDSIGAQLCVWDLNANTNYPNELGVGNITQVEFSQDGQSVAIGIVSGYVDVYNLKTGNKLLRDNYHTNIVDLCFSKDDKYLFTVGEEGKIVVRELDLV